MAFNPISGKSGSVSIAGTAWALSKWEADMTNDLVKAHNFTGLGYKQWVSGLTGATITVSANTYDEGNMPLTVGATVALVLGYTSSVSLSIGSALCKSIKPSIDVEGAEGITATFESNGSFTAAIV